jgi:hypothetical protein
MNRMTVTGQRPVLIRKTPPSPVKPLINRVDRTPQQARDGGVRDFIPGSQS